MIADNNLVIEYLVQEASDIDWTFTRPAMLEEAPSKGKATGNTRL